MNERIFPRVVLQDTDSSLYFQAMDDWTRDPTAAEDFGNLPNAADFVRLSGLTNAHVVLILGANKQEIRI